MYGIGLAKGLGVTFKNLVLPSRAFTIHQYPNKRIGLLGLAKIANTNVVAFAIRNPKETIRSFLGLATVEDHDPRHSRFRGQEFTFYEERCTGCASCAKYCPLGIIEIVTTRSGEDIQEGQKYGLEVFDIDIGRCMFCGLCVEACPYDALHMGSGFEEGTYERKNLVIDMERLKRSEKNPSTWFRPQLERQKYSPFTDVADWKSVGREANRWHPKRPGEVPEELRSEASATGEYT